jgi:hypothetical protein
LSYSVDGRNPAPLATRCTPGTFYVEPRSPFSVLRNMLKGGAGFWLFAPLAKMSSNKPNIKKGARGYEEKLEVSGAGFLPSTVV